MTITKIIALAATAAALSFGTIAQAQEVATISIDTAGVDLSSPASLNHFKSRIERAAKQVCHTNSARELSQITSARECYANAVAAALSKLDQRVARADAKPTGETLAINTAVTK